MGQVRAAIERAASELGATSLAISEHAGNLDIAAHWSRETIRRWHVAGLDMDDEVDHGELMLRFVEEGDGWNVSTFASCVDIDDERVAHHVYSLATDVEQLAALGLRAIAYVDEDGGTGAVARGALIVKTREGASAAPFADLDARVWTSLDPSFADDVRCTCTGPDGALWLGTDDLPTGRVLRWNGHAFVAIDVGTVGMVRALAPAGDGVLAAVSALAEENGQPGFVHIRPARYGELHMTSSRGGTRATWGVTSELATRIARRLGGIAD